MVDPISSGSTGPIAPVPPAPPGAQPSSGKGFMDLLMDNLDEVSRLQGEADQSVQALYSGETDNLAEVFTAVNKAELAFDLLMEIRNKLLEAYREIQQMRL